MGNGLLYITETLVEVNIHVNVCPRMKCTKAIILFAGKWLTEILTSCKEIFCPTQRFSFIEINVNSKLKVGVSKVIQYSIC